MDATVNEEKRRAKRSRLKGKGERAAGWRADPEWVRVRTALLRALDGYPEAREAVARALEEAEAE